MAGDRVRDEAERLVAAAIAAVSLAARGMGAAGRGGSGFATGSPECCVCPVCRVIAAMRDPSSDLADKLAAGAGDLAIGVAGLLRNLGRATGQGGGRGTGEEEPGREGDEFWELLRRRASAAGEAPDDPWRAATSAQSPPAKPMAKKAVAKKAVAQEAVAQEAVAKKVVAKKVVAKKAVAKKAVAKKAVAKKAVAKKVVAKKAVAKKAVTKFPAKLGAPDAEQLPPGPMRAAPAKKLAKKAAKKTAAPPPREFG